MITKVKRWCGFFLLSASALVSAEEGDEICFPLYRAAGAIQGTGFECEITASTANVSLATFFCTSQLPRIRRYCGGVPLVAILLEEKPAPTCSVLNPIESDSGTKRQTELDIESIGSGSVSFSRTYRSQQLAGEPVWRHNYDIKLSVVDPTVASNIQSKSSTYSSQSDACTSGWRDIKSKLTASWALNTSASFANGSCKILNSTGMVVRSLAIVPNVAISSNTQPNIVQIRWSDGTLLSYQYDGTSTFISATGDHGSLKLLNSTSTPWLYASASGDVYAFSAQGKLLRITAPNGLSQTLGYDSASGFLNSVQDSFGGKLELRYTDSLLTSVATLDGKSTGYSYNSLGLVTEVKRPDNTLRKYHYEDSSFPNALTGITDERNVRFATWTYDSQGRAISSRHVGADGGTLTYNNDGSTTVTDSLNKQTIYRFADIAGARRVIAVEGQPSANCVGANQNYTYTPEGWLASKTDWKGIKTTYQYNAVGQEISRTEALNTPEARTTSTEWHPTLYLKTRITEQDKETVFSYDINGRLLNQSVRSLTN